MTEIEKLLDTVKLLRSENGCPWDREQTHGSLKPACIEEAAEVICGINLYEQTGNYDNLLEELGDLLLQIVMHAEIAEEEGLFTFEDVARIVNEKMIRRHPHVFGNETIGNPDDVIKRWDEIKLQEKAGKEALNENLKEAFDESEQLIDRARIRKGYIPSC